MSGGSGGGRKAAGAAALMDAGPGAPFMPAHRPGTQSGSPQAAGLCDVGGGDIGGAG